MSEEIPFPLTFDDEETQLELAIQQSLEDIGSTEHIANSSQTDELGAASDAPVEHKQEQTPPATSSAPVNIPRSNRTPYNRSYSDFYAMPRSVITGRPYLSTSNPITNSWSPPKVTLTTDCCEVARAITLQNDEYLADLKKTISRVTSPLHCAVKRGHMNCLDMLLSSMPSLLNKKNETGESALYLSVSLKNHLAARRLLQAGADPNIPRLNRDTPLQAAVEGGSLELTALLLKAGSNANHPLNRGWTALHESVYQGRDDILRCLLNQGGDANVRDDFGISPVFTSAACGRSDCLEILLNSGGDPNLSALTKSAPPLYEACKEGHVESVKTLLKYGADPHLPNCDGLLPIHIASYKGTFEIVEELLKVTQRAIVEKCGMSPLHSAAKGDNIEILRSLIENGYDVNRKLAKDKITYRDRRQTALFFAIHNDSEEAAELLLEAGANTELDYVKPLLVAVTHGQYEMVDLLLSYGADINATFSSEGTIFPAAIAFALKDYRMMSKLLVAGCDVARCFDCPMGMTNHNEYDETKQKTSFCHFASQEQNSPWMGWVTMHLLEHVGNVTLCSRMLAVLRETDEWEDIKNILRTPRYLMHCSRLCIRKNILSGKRKLPVHLLPPVLRSYVEYDYEIQL